MKETNKTKKQLLDELAKLRSHVNKMEQIESKRKQIEKFREEKELIEKALNTQKDTFFIFNPSTGRAIRWNKAFNKVSGYSDKEIQSMKAPDSYYSKEDFKKAEDATGKILKGETVTLELSLITKDGRSIPTEYTASVIRDDAGKPKYIIAIGRDITERKLLEEDIRERKDKYQSLYQEFRGILDAIPDALVLLSKDLKVIWSNEIAAKNMNMSLDEFIGQHCYKVRHGRAEPCEKCPVLECFATHKPKIVEATTPDGRIWELHVYPVFGERGEVKGVIEAAHNITERKKNEEEMRNSKEELNKRIKELEDFYNMAVGRELRMKQLKEENKELKEELEKYKKS